MEYEDRKETVPETCYPRQVSSSLCSWSERSPTVWTFEITSAWVLQQESCLEREPITSLFCLLPLPIYSRLGVLSPSALTLDLPVGLLTVVSILNEINCSLFTIVLIWILLHFLAFIQNLPCFLRLACNHLVNTYEMKWKCKGMKQRAEGPWRGPVFSQSISRLIVPMGWLPQVSADRVTGVGPQLPGCCCYPRAPRLLCVLCSLSFVKTGVESVPMSSFLLLVSFKGTKAVLGFWVSYWEFTVNIDRQSLLIGTSQPHCSSAKSKWEALCSTLTVHLFIPEIIH